MLPDGQAPTVAFNVLAQMCGPEANETEMGVAPFTKIVREGTLTSLTFSSLFLSLFHLFVLKVYHQSSDYTTVSDCNFLAYMLFHENTCLVRP